MADDKTAKPVRWAHYYGEFEWNDLEVRFLGRTISVPVASAEVSPSPSPEIPQDRASFGLSLSNRTVADGSVVADVTFEAWEPESTCEIAVSYDANATHLVSAGLGGADFALYSIREFGGPKNGNKGSWLNHRLVGERPNLRAGHSYHLEARFRGATVTLAVDGVDVGTAEVASPLGRARQVGLFFRGRSKITVQGFGVKTTKAKAFVVMQFGPEYDDLYTDVVTEVCKDFEVNVLRGDEMSGPGIIISDIVREIDASQLVIADITPTTNANVYFEVGYALALNKPTILLARKGTPLPFDVAGFRVLFYENTIGGKNKLEKGLRSHIDAILST